MGGHLTWHYDHIVQREYERAVRTWETDSPTYTVTIPTAVVNVLITRVCVPGGWRPLLVSGNNQSGAQSFMHGYMRQDAQTTIIFGR